MKNLILIVIMALFSVGAMAQKVTIDTIQGNETVNFEKMLWPKSIQALCTQTGGTSDGTLRLQGSLDGNSWQYVTETEDLANFYPNDTLTITDGAVLLINIKEKAFPYWRLVGTGTVGDSTKVTIKYFKQ